MGLDDYKHSFGIFKPVGHVVISLPDAGKAQAAQQALADAGVTQDVRRISAEQMVEQIDSDLANASPLAAVGQEINLVRAQRELATRGYHFLVVKAEDAALAAQVAAIAQGHGAERAQLYGNFLIEELIDRPGNLNQVGESPDRGLDAQTPSGLEAEATGKQPDAPGHTDRH